MFMKTEFFFNLITLGVVLVTCFSTVRSQQEERVARSQNGGSAVGYKANSWWSKRALLPTTPGYAGPPLPDQWPAGTSIPEAIPQYDCDISFFSRVLCAPLLLQYPRQ
ncbi:uncharacterized protein LOC143023874 [Oratosquilla oratoria]|uniref:uncharacterized protein LOC143023874 n=1 Tax=Oratosquilla oratoria TaxID=337810 RepID=UPI003F7761B0